MAKPKSPFSNHDFGGSAQTFPGGLLRPVSVSSPAQSTTAASPARAQAAASPEHLYELGLTTAAMSYHTAALEALSECTRVAPDHAPAWRRLAELLRLAGKDDQAAAAELAAQASAHVKWKKGSDKRTPARRQKAEKESLAIIRKTTEAEAAQALREHLVKDPLDAVALRWLARLEARSRDTVTARALFKRALELCPDYDGAREDYAGLLVDEHEYAAIAETARLLARQPDNPRYQFLRAHALMDGGKHQEATDVLTRLLRKDPNNAACWLLYGTALRSTGRREEAHQAYRKCLDVQPDMGEAYWALAELKDKVLTPDDVDDMRSHLEKDTLAPESRMHLLYAMGQTLERAGDFPESFAAYSDAARVFWETEQKKPRDRDAPIESVSRLDRIKAVFSKENLDSKLIQAPADSNDTPIFVVGMPRAGSTLVEQILSAHSRVEAIGERALIGDIARALAHSRIIVEQDAYPNCLLELTRDRLAQLGEQVIAESRNYRATERPCFVDKRPWNWLDVGLIHLILPQARIIDVRREPMAACFAMYKQMLPKRSCAFSYDLKELGRYYNNYVRMMDHWQTVLPGRVHFLQYERLVEDTETEIRRMLDYCGLPFEEGCLRFWESDRAIATPSAEQVRRPIYRDALQQWRSFESWLDPLKESLGNQGES